MRLAMLIPSRQRPKAAWEAAYGALERAQGDTHIFVCVDGDDDPGYHDDAALMVPGVHRCYKSTRHGLVATLNRWGWAAADGKLSTEPFTHIGFMGDDHRVRTPGWDLTLMETAGTGLAYGNDLLQRSLLPTAIVMHADIVRALGRMAPPTLWHMYCDDYWLALGRAGNGHGVGITYRDDVVIEHLHPAAGKAQMDDSYNRTNSPQQFEADREAWRQFVLDGGVEADLYQILAHRGGL